MNPPRSILIIEPQPLFLEGLLGALSEEWPDAILNTTHTATEGREHLRKGPPQVALVDLDAFDPHASLLREFIVAAYPAPVLVMAARSVQEDINRVLTTGARGFLPKTMTGPAIFGAILIALSGGVCFPTQALREALAAPAEDLRRPRGKRELEILAHLADGSSNKAIARELGVSVATVKLYVRSILQSTGSRNRIEAIANARRMGLLPVR